MLETEARMMAAVEASRTKQFRLTEDVLIKASLSNEQRHALFHITETDGGVKVVAGMAGTGKTTLLAAAREVWEASGYQVIGASLSGKAAQGLEGGAGIESDTIHRRLLDLDKGTLSITPKTILVIDEAGMVGTRQMERLVSATQEAGGKLVLVGDAKQLQPIEAGGPFKAIAERVGAAELTDIRRQRDERDHAAVKEIAGGRAENALRSYAERGLLRVEDDRRGAIEKLISDWRREVGRKPEDGLIITGTRLEAATINKLAQEARKVAGELGQRTVRVDGTLLFEKDRILFTKNSRLYGVKNGNLGTIEKIDERSDTITAKLDTGQRVTVSLSHYQDIRLGYAITTHKGQGVTVEKSFVLAGGEMQDRELSYVQASRARRETRLYTDRNEVGDVVTTLAQQMNKSRQKEIALDLTEGPKENSRDVDKVIMRSL
jgi:Ti-type conjugative transfer relaxase TraA